MISVNLGKSKVIIFLQFLKWEIVKVINIDAEKYDFKLTCDPFLHLPFAILLSVLFAFSILQASFQGNNKACSFYISRMKGPFLNHNSIWSNSKSVTCPFLCIQLFKQIYFSVLQYLIFILNGFIIWKCTVVSDSFLLKLSCFTGRFFELRISIYP